MGSHKRNSSWYHSAFLSAKMISDIISTQMQNGQKLDRQFSGFPENKASTIILVLQRLARSKQNVTISRDVLGVLDYYLIYAYVFNSNLFSL